MAGLLVRAKRGLDLRLHDARVPAPAASAATAPAAATDQPAAARPAEQLAWSLPGLVQSGRPGRRLVARVRRRVLRDVDLLLLDDLLLHRRLLDDPLFLLLLRRRGRRRWR